MLGQLLQHYRAKRRQAFEQVLVGQFAAELGPYQKAAALIYPETEYVRDTEAAYRVAALKSVLGDRLSCVVTPDPAWKPVAYSGLPVKTFDEVAGGTVDCVFIPSSQFTEVLFHLFNLGTARRLPLVAPALAGVPHRLFLRRELFNVLDSIVKPRVLEIGSIEHPLGGHRTTQALAETLWGQGSLTTIDINAFTLKLAEMYCAGTPTDIEYLAGDCREVLKKSEPTQLDFVLLHFMSDNSAQSGPLIEAFDLLEARLSSGAPIVFQAVATGDPMPGSLQAHLRTKSYKTTVSAIAGTSNPSRFFVVARHA